MIAATVDEMYREDEQNRFLEVTYQNGDKEILYYKDFSSGAMIENIVRRAKKLAIKRLIAGGTKGVRTDDLVDSIKQEYKEHEDLPNTTNPDDWAKISGKKGERIVFIRTLVNSEKDKAEGGRAIERVATGPVPLAGSSVRSLVGATTRARRCDALARLADLRRLGHDVAPSGKNAAQDGSRPRTTAADAAERACVLRAAIQLPWKP